MHDEVLDYVKTKVNRQNCNGVSYVAKETSA